VILDPHSEYEQHRNVITSRRSPLTMSIKFGRNPSTYLWVTLCSQTHRQTDRRTDRRTPMIAVVAPPEISSQSQVK